MRKLHTSIKEYRGHYRCEKCKKMVIKINSHHIIPERFNTTKRNTSIAELCSGCHAQIHQLYTKNAFELALKSNLNFFEEIWKEFINEKKND